MYFSYRYIYGLFLNCTDKFHPPHGDAQHRRTKVSHVQQEIRSDGQFEDAHGYA